MSYPEKIKFARETLLMTQEELALELGVTPITVCRWETGKVEPSIKAKKAFPLTRIMANTKEQISRNMRSNKSKDTKPELMLRKELWRRGLRYRKNYKPLAGKPDIVFLRAQIAVFVDGKMWHGYDWEHPKNDFKSHQDFWIPKIEHNMERDFEVTQNLIELGWLVLRFWDFEIKKDVAACADKIEQAYRNRTESEARDAEIQIN